MTNDLPIRHAVPERADTDRRTITYPADLCEERRDERDHTYTLYLDLGDRFSGVDLPFRTLGPLPGVRSGVQPAVAHGGKECSIGMGVELTFRRFDDGAHGLLELCLSAGLFSLVCSGCSSSTGNRCRPVR